MIAFAFQTMTEVTRAPQDVFAYITDLRNWSRFPGWGPLPGIVEATLPEGESLRLGARVRVRNSDRSVHHEIVTTFEPPHRYAVTMKLSPPAAYVMRRIEEEVEIVANGSGSRLLRTFRVVPRSIFTLPIAALIRICLERAVHAHNELARQDLES